MHKILLTCPPMIGMASSFKGDFEKANFDVTIPDFQQEMTEDELCEIIGDFDGWIIGDDPATRRVLEAGIKGKLKACMRWGVGTDNVDFDAFNEHQIPITNTPGVFGREVADVACHYVTALARETFNINEAVKNDTWLKPIGKSLWASSAVIVGFGDIGQQLAKRLLAHDMKVKFVDPNVSQSQAGKKVTKVTWPHCLSHVDYVIFTAPLNQATYHMFNDKALNACRKGIKIINVGRGPLIDENVLVKGIKTEIISAAALDVFEKEPYNSATHQHLKSCEDKMIFGSHNGSNTREAVEYVSRICIQKLHEFLVTGSQT